MLVLAIGIIYALPNFYAPDPALQISARRAGNALPYDIEDRIGNLLAQHGITARRIETEDNGNLLVRLDSAEQQLQAQELLAPNLNEDAVVALNLAPTTPQWMRSIGAHPMSLGLDLSGGVHFLMEVDEVAALENRLSLSVPAIKKTLRDKKIRYRRISEINSGLLALFRSEEDRDRALPHLRLQYTDFASVNETSGGSPAIRMLISEAREQAIIAQALEQNLTTLRNRVNELGVSQPVVQRQGSRRIVVQLPGVQDTAQAKNIIGKTANLEFRLAALPSTPRFEQEVFGFRNQPSGMTATLLRDIIVTGEKVIDATPGFDENQQPRVLISLDVQGGQAMNRATRNNVGRSMGVVFIEERSVYREDENGEMQLSSVKEKSLINLATIRGALSSEFQITGLDSPAESSELALLLRAGALAAPMRYAEERVIGPSLGRENIQSGIWSVSLGFVLVILFMLFYYRLFGVISAIALSTNLLLMASVMSILQATLTLPGIAGFVLTVGMAVDANVLIFSRIREELAAGSIPAVAIDRGYGRAFVSILDANITTLLVALILYAIGTGSVKGFAVTLAVGILTSMFTAIVLSRAITNLVYGAKGKKLSIGAAANQ